MQCLSISHMQVVCYRHAVLCSVNIVCFLSVCIVVTRELWFG